jgi:hypothetical protein
LHTLDLPSASTAPDFAENDWPRCGPCGRDLMEDELGRYACWACETRAGEDLRAIADLFPQLNVSSALAPVVNRSGSTPGDGGAAPGRGVTAPVPLRLDVLALTAAGGVATRLQALEDAWRAALGRRIATWAGSPAQAVPVHVDFLRINLQWAAERYEGVDSDFAEIRRLRAEMVAALSATSRPARIGIGRCPARLEDGSVCGNSLTTTAATRRVRCSACGACWVDVAAWVELRRAQTAAAAA